jgi:hypothetical protein
LVLGTLGVGDLVGGVEGFHIVLIPLVSKLLRLFSDAPGRRSGPRCIASRFHSMCLGDSLRNGTFAAKLPPAGVSMKTLAAAGFTVASHTRCVSRITQVRVNLAPAKAFLISGKDPTALELSRLG